MECLRQHVQTVYFFDSVFVEFIERTLSDLSQVSTGTGLEILDT